MAIVITFLLAVGFFFDKTNGLNCLGETCHNGQICEFFIPLHKATCVAHHGQGPSHNQCIGAHHPNDHCYCLDQSCIDIMEHDFQHLTTHQAATAMPTHAPITNDPTTVPVVQHVTTHQPAITMPTHAPTTNAPTTDTTTVNGGQTSTETPTSAVVVACADNEDPLFSCHNYQDLYNMCHSFSETLKHVAKTRCPKFCGLCGSGTVPTQSSMTGGTTLPSCVDHDQRCTQSTFQQILCHATNPETKKYAIMTCPVSCNYCKEYIASIELMLYPTTPAQPVTCNVCGDIITHYPCSQKDISQNITTDKCPADKRFCMTDFFQDRQGGSDVFKRCVTEAECQQKWINESADQDYCNKFGTVFNPSAFECHFCCTGDRCNTDIMPPSSTLVAKPTGK